MDGDTDRGARRPSRSDGGRSERSGRSDETTPLVVLRLGATAQRERRPGRSSKAMPPVARPEFRVGVTGVRDDGAMQRHRVAGS